MAKLWSGAVERFEEQSGRNCREKREGTSRWSSKNDEEKQVNKMTRYEVRTLQKWSKTKQRGNRPNAERNENVHSSCGLIKTAKI